MSDTTRKYTRHKVDLTALSKATGIPYATLHYRITHGIPLKAPQLKNYTAFGRSQPIQDWAAELGVEKKLVYDRIRYYAKSYEMTQTEALEYVLRANGIKK